MPGRLSVVIPVYNERRTLRELIARVQAVRLPLEKEIICVDDCSTDGTTDILRELAATQPNLRVLFQPVNRGKGAALREGFRQATGDYVIVQDADLEYDPEDYPQMLAPLLEGKADVVFGSRFMGGRPHRVLYFWHSVGNRLLTLLSNMVSDLNLTDMETCYKAFRREVIQSIVLEQDRFGFEPEITIKVARRRLRVYEVGISYYGRTYEEGKKIGWKDGIQALWCIAKYGLTVPRTPLPLPPAEAAAYGSHPAPQTDETTTLR
ncbi:glycosyltransferase family 2 protein [Chloracidobacterium aggregatum]|uniref:Glycosyltransferase family 2 protein n=1 Tax=Chloracidobacterium sp. N TaxID=2821540 RepID=A0ABX8AYM3_9BACT|nr:glycosyltransferase family 2 protein [Chloracidobacterium aggregatum]QUV84713.1 glycosyltransferase family 2 protein [Chloracidobacterium sp. 2]QUV84729.1 glycosyltransferase family 2 protein [Chloracidobacterium sp. 2]QUV86784.1 glycosyltransferase family 2 protein [Chloracidobacterium sp. S]QUV91783.1 glycosyltransferase family 2 protein [Chloracidobacterium sp. A]QUV92917.1 glycosyltransferase family 2 protein [Chloracidobacterium sp. N]